MSQNSRKVCFVSEESLQDERNNTTTSDRILYSVPNNNREKVTTFATIQPEQILPQKDQARVADGQNVSLMLHKF